MSDDLTPDEIRANVQALKSQARQGADALHARATVPERQPKLNNSESAAIARAKIDRGVKP